MSIRNNIFMIALIISLVMFLILVSQSEARIDVNSVIGMWLFEENRGDTVYDSTENKLDGKFVNDVKWTNGKFGKAIVVTGESHVNFGNQPSLNVGLGNFSLVAWIKTSDDPPDWHCTIIHKAVWPAPRHGYVLCVRGKLDPGNLGKPLLWIGLGTEHGVHLFGTFKINDGKWHHLAGTVDRKSVMKLYVDGEFNAQENIIQYIKENEDNVSNFYIGGEQGRSHVIERSIDEVAVFNTVLSDADIKSIYERGLESALGFIAVSSSEKLAITWGGLKYQ